MRLLGDQEASWNSTATAGHFGAGLSAQVAATQSLLPACTVKRDGEMAILFKDACIDLATIADICWDCSRVELSFQ